MFAVSHKPTTLGRFIVKQEKKTLKDTKTPKQAKQANESNEVKIFKTKVITAPIPEKTNVVTVNEAIVDKKTEAEQNKEVKPIKRLKFKLSVVRDIPYQPNTEKKVMKRIKDSKQKQKRSNREGNFNCGRWQQEEHQRFIEAILKYGNEWKQVQKHVGTRSSTQARSHAQKFFVKMKKSNILDLDIDLSKNSIKTLHDLANSMNSDEYINAIKALNCIAFERKNISKKKQRKEELGANMSESDIFANEINSTVNFGSDELFSLNTTDYQTLLISVDKDKKQIQEEYNQLNQFTLNSNPVHNNTKYPFSYTVKSENITNTTQTQIGNTIIINNNINTFNYNLNFKEKKDFFKKRNRYNSSFDGIFNLFPNIDKDLGNFGNMQRKNCDDADYVNNFNCTFKDNIFSNVKNDFEDENDLEDLIMISNTPSNYQSRKVSCDTFFVDLMNIGNNA